jgi:hypothetical protein
MDSDAINGRDLQEKRVWVGRRAGTQEVAINAEVGAQRRERVEWDFGAREVNG